MWTDPSGRCPWWLTAVCDATGLDPDNLDAGAYIKGGLGLNRDASLLEVTAAVVETPVASINPYNALLSTYSFVTDAEERATFFHNLTSPAVWWQGIKQPWQEYGQGLQCRDAYLVGRGTVGITNELLAAYGLVRGGQALRTWWRAPGLAGAGAPQPVYFRGTSEGFPGSAALQRIGITPASTDPVVATIFATESSNYGRGVVYIAAPEDLTGVSIGQGNVLAATELEVGIDLAPTEFAGRASIVISADQARTILQGMGISIPARIGGPAGITEVLANTPRLSPAQISQFFQRAIELTGR